MRNQPRRGIERGKRMIVPVRAKPNPELAVISQLGACAQALAEECQRYVAKGQYLYCWDASRLQIMLDQVTTKAKEAGLEVRQ